MNAQRFLIAILFLGLVGCTTVEATPQRSLPNQIEPENGGYPDLSESEIRTLHSLKQIDAYPLYTMHYYAQYDSFVFQQPARVFGNLRSREPPAKLKYTNLLPGNTHWACSLFTAFANSDHYLYGRNFDWVFSPALLLFTDPPDGYASATMVDIAYLGFSDNRSKNLTEKPLDDLVGLLNAPYLPFDGINEAGLTIGMAAVPAGNIPVDPMKDTLGSLEVMRAVLDVATNVGEALEILTNHNIDFEGGPPVHYLIADASGKSAILEHYQGEIHIFHNQTSWQQATNFLNASVDSPKGQCWRYDAISEWLETAQGSLMPSDAMNLLKDVSQDNTQWSVVYDMGRGDIHIVMGRNFDKKHLVPFELTNP